MSLSTPAVKSSRFARYATASAAALGAAAAADAQFVGDFSLTSGGGNTGAWNASASGSAGVSAGGAPDSVTFNASGTTSSVNLYLATPVAADTTVSFDWSISSSAWGGDTFSASFDPGTGAQAFWTRSANGDSGSGQASFLVSAGSSFGFLLNAAYVHGSGTLTISNFSAVTAVPEPGTTGLLAGCAALGFIAVAGARAKRRRAAASPAE